MKLFALFLLVVLSVGLPVSACRARSQPATPGAPAGSPQSQGPRQVTDPEELKYGQELKRLDGWETDVTRASVPLKEVRYLGLRRDAIPPIYEPRFQSVKEADKGLDPQEQVIAFEFKGDARAYPIRILIFHEIVNDVVGGEPVAVTY